MINKLGVIVDQLVVNQSNHFLIKNLNWLSQNKNIDCCIFYNELNNMVLPITFGCFHINEIYDYHGIVISTTLTSTKRLLSCPGPTKKYFYIWTLDWMKLPKFDFDHISEMYLSDEVDLIVRSNRYSNVLEHCFKKPKFIIDNWNAVQLAELCTI
jgi:hypothetical protein